MLSSWIHGKLSMAIFLGGSSTHQTGSSLQVVLELPRSISRFRCMAQRKKRAHNLRLNI